MPLVTTCCGLFWEPEVSLAWPIRMVVEFLICWVEDVVVGYVAVIAIAHLVMAMMTMMIYKLYESLLLVITCCRLFWELEIVLAWPIHTVVKFLARSVKIVVMGLCGCKQLSMLVMLECRHLRCGCGLLGLLI